MWSSADRPRVLAVCFTQLVTRGMSSAVKLIQPTIINADKPKLPKRCRVCMWREPMCIGKYHLGSAFETGLKTIHNAQALQCLHVAITKPQET